MISKLTMKGIWAKRVGAKKQKTFRFKSGVNLLIGPNGSGKSSIFSAILKHISKWESDRKEAKKLVPIEHTSDVIKFLDFEKQNPRVASSFVSELSMGFQAGAYFRSHGEVNKDFIENLKCDDFKDALVMIDEPDQALDLNGVKKLIICLKKCPAIQIIAAVHNPLLVFSNFNIIELEDGYRSKMCKAFKSIYI